MSVWLWQWQQQWRRKLVRRSITQFIVASDVVASRPNPLPEWMSNYTTQSKNQATNPPAQNTRSEANIVTIMDKVMLSCVQMNPTIKIDPKQAASQKYLMELLCEMERAVVDAETGDLLEYRHLLCHPKYQKFWGKSFGKEIGRLAQKFTRCGQWNWHDGFYLQRKNTLRQLQRHHLHKIFLHSKAWKEGSIQVQNYCWWQSNQLSRRLQHTNGCSPQRKIIAEQCPLHQGSWVYYLRHFQFLSQNLAETKIIRQVKDRWFSKGCSWTLQVTREIHPRRFCLCRNQKRNIRIAPKWNPIQRDVGREIRKSRIQEKQVNTWFVDA